MRRPGSEQSGYAKPKLMELQNGSVRRFRNTKRFKIVLPNIRLKNKISPFVKNKKVHIKSKIKKKV